MKKKHNEKGQKERSIRTCGNNMKERECNRRQRESMNIFKIP